MLNISQVLFILVDLGFYQKRKQKSLLSWNLSSSGKEDQIINNRNNLRGVERKMYYGKRKKDTKGGTESTTGPTLYLLGMQ